MMKVTHLVLSIKHDLLYKIGINTISVLLKGSVLVPTVLERNGIQKKKMNNVTKNWEKY